MKPERNIFYQLKSISLVIVKIYLPAIMLLFGLVFVRLIYKVDIGAITRDPLQLFEAPPFVGMVSNIGILCWCSAMAICFFSSKIIQKKFNDYKIAQFLFYSSVVTCILMIDDLFLFHEIVLPDYLHIQQIIIYPTYVIMIAVYLFKFYKTILRTDYILLLLAFVFFGTSIIIDILSEHIVIPEVFFFEDGVKFLGVIGWATYYIRTSFQEMTAQINR